jgi:hypothetical protein
MRRVLIGDRLLWTLDSLFPANRGGDRASRNDFERHELWSARDYFASIGTTQAPYPPRSDISTQKTLISRGRHVPCYQVVGQELRDGTIELVGISIDFEGLNEPDED